MKIKWQNIQVLQCLFASQSTSHSRDSILFFLVQLNLFFLSSPFFHVNCSLLSLLKVLLLSSYLFLWLPVSLPPSIVVQISASHSFLSAFSCCICSQRFSLFSILGCDTRMLDECLCLMLRVIRGRDRDSILKALKSNPLDPTSNHLN